MKGLDTIKERFERDAVAFDAIYRLEDSTVSRWFNLVFRKAVFRRYEICFERCGKIEGADVLDIGCGSGIYSVDFARRGARSVLGMDFSAPMLELAKKEASKHGVTDACVFKLQNFMEASFDKQFGITIAMGVFDYLADPEVFLKKMASVTNGTIIASFPAPSLLRQPVRRARYRLTGKGDVYFYKASAVRNLAAKAGLHDVQLVSLGRAGNVLVAQSKGS